MTEPVLSFRDRLRAGGLLPEPAQPANGAQPVRAVADSDAASRYADAALTAEVERVAGAAEGTRNDTLNRASFAVGQLVAGGALDAESAAAALAGAAGTAGLLEREITVTIQSGFTAAASSPRTVPERPELVSFTAPSSSGPQPDASRLSLRSKLLTRAQLADLPQPAPLIADTLDRGTLVLLAGYTGTCKTFIALDWACCVASGHPWQGRLVEQGPVLYIAAEGAAGLHERISAWETAWASSAGGLTLLAEPVSLLNRAAVTELAELASADGYRLVVIDTLARSIVGADENSARDVGLAVDAAECIRRGSGATLALVHHTGKDKSTVRGSSALEAAADTVYVTEGDEVELRLSRTKRKEGPREDEHQLRLSSIGASCVLLESVRGQDRVSTDSERRLLAAVADTFADTLASKAELRTVAAMPPATFHRALNALVRRGAIGQHGSEQRPLYRVVPGRHA